MSEPTERVIDGAWAGPHVGAQKFRRQCVAASPSAPPPSSPPSPPSPLPAPPPTPPPPLAPPLPHASPETLCDGFNTNTSEYLDGSSQGGVPFAVRYVPSTTLLVSRVEVVTGEVAGASSRRVHSDNAATGAAGAGGAPWTGGQGMPGRCVA